MKDKKKYDKLLKKSLNKLNEASEHYINALIYGRGISSVRLFFEIEEKDKLFNPPIGFISRLLRLTKEYTLKPFDGIGNLMTFKSFKICVENGGFIDYDGFGYYSTKEKQSNITIYPSDITGEVYRKDFTHVKWYNR